MAGASNMAKRVRYVKQMGVTHIDMKQEIHKIDRNKDLEHYKDIIYQCGKCGTCRTVYQDAD